ncbi:hypothetical protein P3L10_010551 [Capsicum annuum]|uniref:uncharacterized protein LOC107863988 n=1 Tax=Capsicum annuum TaxID=4072 RepID=UPI0007BF6E33|nr:uncharacterized protein LOC107863988 [Capsicum annuum]
MEKKKGFVLEEPGESDPPTRNRDYPLYPPPYFPVAGTLIRQKFREIDRNRQKKMTISLSKIGKVLPFSRLFRQLELDMETVVKVLQPGPLGIVEHKFSAEEIQKASDTVKQAVSNWRRHANTEKHSPIMKDFIDA